MSGDPFWNILDSLDPHPRRPSKNNVCQQNSFSTSNSKNKKNVLLLYMNRGYDWSTSKTFEKIVASQKGSLSCEKLSEGLKKEVIIKSLILVINK